MVKHVDKVTTKENDIGLQGLGRYFFQISCICNQFMKYEIILQLREGDEGREWCSHQVTLFCTMLSPDLLQEY